MRPTGGRVHHEAGALARGVRGDTRRITETEHPRAREIRSADLRAW